MKEIIDRLREAEGGRQKAEDETFQARMEAQTEMHSQVMAAINECIKGLNNLIKTLGKRPTL